MPLPQNITFNSFLPPAIVHAPSGKTFVCPGWIEVSPDVTLEEVHSRWTQHEPSKEKEPTIVISETVISSSGKGGYIVEFDGNYWSCSCPGFGFRRACRHVKEIKQKHI